MEAGAAHEHPAARNNFQLNRGRQRKPRGELKSANLNELDKLVSLQTSLWDAQSVLQEIVENCNRLIEEDSGSLLRRQSSELEYRLRHLQEQRESLDDDIRHVQERIASRKEKLRQRRMRLAEARALHEDDLLTEFDAGVQLAEEKKRVKALKGEIEPVRTSLLSTLAFIFPIELLSPPDLLYTILGVPLPIPMQGSDPAPPLSLPHVPAVSEDGVASALGYAALLVHLMAAYLCQRLLYPITYIGSRSLVKDPISAMMGPRMFPLYSKGVDTYRFEYAVFLLNKDIELLMADRNLHALDLRHTLPNLKNLLLTLTSGEGALRSRVLTSPSVVSITPGLQSPSPFAAEVAGTEDSEPPPLNLEGDEAGWSTTPKSRAVGLPPINDKVDNRINTDGGNRDVNGGATMRSAATEDTSDLSTASTNEERSGTSSTASTLRPRLPRIQIQSYLGLTPLSAMWRGRGASSSSGASSSKQAGSGDMVDSSEPSASRPGSVGDGVVANGTGTDTESTSECGEDDDEEDEDDRQTVRGSSVPTTPVAGDRSRRESVASEGLLDNLKDLKSRLRGGGSTNVLHPEAEKRSDSVNGKDRDVVVDTTC
ncbi:uncharacterized protein FOMMEDRAFT_19606 [Fomitiporia mediterranea MF3/22]|uniref:uncharacterized protein n=1 Tax=Fomitiporia mediterranea (strain MF3/22) TaxID=694068 RepID=UPI0004409A1A|nr:uncharacterized protein FOMMEDRAFT_19606 [Fomitiporia mediterranea MF3/22]EJD04359.1 hypothetical protein FOMMEDRAFT_19606 [Fomitiporia mediterranea MF3/22]